MRTQFSRQPCSSCILRGSPAACELPAAASTSGSSKKKKAADGLASDSSRGSGTKHRRLSDQVSPPLYRKPEQSSHSRSVESEPSNFDAASLHRRIANLESRLSIHLQDSRYCVASTSHRSTPRGHRNEATRLADEHLNALLAALPSRQDCEMVLEYLLQEADWLVAYLDASQIEQIWSRFVNGAHVTRVESAVLASAIALSACLLCDGPHIFYTPTMALDAFPSALVEYAQRYLTDREQQTVQTARLLAASTPDILNELLLLALLNDCFPYRAHVTGERYPSKRHMIHYWQQSIDFLDERSAFWQRLDGAERECLRRLSWHFVNFERWMSIYGQYTPANPFCRADVQLCRPRYVSAPLKAPLGGGLAASKGRLAFRRPLKGSARVFRVKDEQEVQETSTIAGLFIDLSQHCLAVSHYISALEAWRRDRASTRADTRHDASSDQQREHLLDQASALCRDLKQWKQEISVCCVEVSRLDTSDYSHCRRASQAAVIYTGIRQLLNIVLGAWVTEHSIWYRPEQKTTSVMPQRQQQQQQRLLQTLQWDAFDNARGAVRSVDTVRKLVLSGTAVQTPWTAMSLFDAAKMLAIPLLSASRWPRGKTEAERMASHEGEYDDDYPQVVRIDRPLEIHEIQITAAEGEQLSQSIHTGAGTGHLEPMDAQRKSEMRRLASDLLCLLELLSLFRNNLLGSEARKRLAMLIDTFSAVHGGGARRATGDVAGMHEQSMHPTTTSTTPSHDSSPNGLREEAAALTFAPVDMESNKAVLESLIGQNDAWWNELLYWE